MTEMTEAVSARPAARPNRRRLLLAGSATAAVSAAALTTARPADAASGQALVLGRANGQTNGTSLTGPSSVPSLTVTNTGSGAAASFQSTSSNGFAGGTRAPNHYGLSANNNSAAQGGGAAMAASGGVNTGITVNTAGRNRNAIAARHDVPLLAATGSEAALGAVGNNTNGVVAETDNVDTFGVLATHFGSGVAVLGASAAGIGVLGTATGGGSGVYALADDAGSFSLTADGTAQFLTDVVVMGTLYAPNIVASLPPAPAQATAGASGATTRTAASRRLAQRSARTAARIRAAHE